MELKELIKKAQTLISAFQTVKWFLEGNEVKGGDTIEDVLWVYEDDVREFSEVYNELREKYGKTPIKDLAE